MVSVFCGGVGGLEDQETVFKGNDNLLGELD